MRLPPPARAPAWVRAWVQRRAGPTRPPAALKTPSSAAGLGAALPWARRPPGRAAPAGWPGGGPRPALSAAPGQRHRIGRQLQLLLQLGQLFAALPRHRVVAPNLGLESGHMKRQVLGPLAAGRQLFGHDPVVVPGGDQAQAAQRPQVGDQLLAQLFNFVGVRDGTGKPTPLPWAPPDFFAVASVGAATATQAPGAHILRRPSAAWQCLGRLPARQSPA